jgi:hypothetical protein
MAFRPSQASKPLASIDGHISEKKLTGLHRLYLGILLPGCALLVSAIIQATTQGLSVYHAILVLQLSWINNTSALIFFQFALIAQIGQPPRSLCLNSASGKKPHSHLRPIIILSDSAIVDKWLGHQRGRVECGLYAGWKGLVSGSGDGVVKYWDISIFQSGRGGGDSVVTEPLEYKGHTVRSYFSSLFIIVQADGVSSDAQWVASALYDKTAIVWDARTTARQCTLVGHKDAVVSVDFSTYIVTGGHATLRLRRYVLVLSSQSIWGSRQHYISLLLTKLPSSSTFESYEATAHATSTSSSSPGKALPIRYCHAGYQTRLLPFQKMFDRCCAVTFYQQHFACGL